MKELTASFQLEIRYGNILNFSNIYRELLAPFIKLTDSIRIDKQNTVEERIHLFFGNSDYTIIASWDRLILISQGDLSIFAKRNSPLEMPFLRILSKLSSLEGFSTVKNVLLLGVFILRTEKTKDEVLISFRNNLLQQNVSNILEEHTDLAVVVAKKQGTQEIQISLGPYLGPSDITKRTIQPLNLAKLGDLEFAGNIIEFKYFEETSKFDLNTFQQIYNFIKEKNRVVWQIVQQ